MAVRPGCGRRARRQRRARPARGSISRPDDARSRPPARPGPRRSSRSTSPARPGPDPWPGSPSSTPAGWSTAALETLDRLADEGWRTVAGDPPGRPRSRDGRDAATERTESFDPFAAILGPRSDHQTATASRSERPAADRPVPPLERLRAGARSGRPPRIPRSARSRTPRSTSAGSRTSRSRDGATKSAGRGPNRRSIASGSRTAVDAQPSRDWKAIDRHPADRLADEVAVVGVLARRSQVASARSVKPGEVDRPVARAGPPRRA